MSIEWRDLLFRIWYMIYDICEGIEKTEYEGRGVGLKNRRRFFFFPGEKSPGFFFAWKHFLKKLSCSGTFRSFNLVLLVRAKGKFLFLIQRNDRPNGIWLCHDVNMGSPKSWRLFGERRSNAPDELSCLHGSEKGVVCDDESEATPRWDSGAGIQKRRSG